MQHMPLVRRYSKRKHDKTKEESESRKKIELDYYEGYISRCNEYIANHTAEINSLLFTIKQTEEVRVHGYVCTRGKCYNVDNCRSKGTKGRLMSLKW